MSAFLYRTRKLLFGETWLLPIGVAVLVGGGGLVLRPLDHGAWHDLGVVFLLVGAVVLVVAAVERGAGAAKR
ncbi:MAG: hypothetical protein AAGC46_02275 [Solirubrobacteraceae bacterium]|nr:hypothetical protein [Patulibacter sp.]